MPPIEKIQVNVSELNSDENISIAAGDGPLKITDTSKQTYSKEASFPCGSINRKKLTLKRGSTKIPRPSSREAEKEQQKDTICPKPVEARNIEDKKALSLARKAFKIRKSLTQMEIYRNRMSNRNSRAIVPASLALQPISSIESSLERSFRINDEFYCFAGSEPDETDAKFAGMKIFASIMLNAWRRRRDDVRRLSDEVNRMKKNSIRVKNQIHVLNSLFKIEQKQNDELNSRLRRMADDQKKIQDMYDELNLSFVDMKAKNCLMEKELLIREKEYEGLNLVLSETKTQLFKCMSHERDLESSLSSEQRKNQELENNKNELLNQLAQVKFDSCEKEVRFQEQLAEKDEQISKLKTLLEALEKRLSELKIKESQVREYEKLDMAQRKTIEDMKMQLEGLRTIVTNTWTNKMKSLWTKFPDKSLKYFHFLMFYLLPALPPPAIKSIPAPKIDKALNLIWNC